MSTQTTDEFLTQALDNNGGDLSPAQAAQLLQMEMGTPGDTGATAPELSSGPAAAPAPTESQTPGTPAATPEPDLNAENAVIQAKDGVHTISYDKLVQARENARTAQANAQALAAQLEAANAKLSELQAQAQARADAGQAPTQADNNAAAAQAAIDAGVDPDLFGDYSPEAIARGLGKLNADSLAELRAEVAELRAKLQPIEAQKALSAEEAHKAAIYGAHPDADSIFESQQFATWKDAQPSIVRAALDQALANGSAAQIVEVFSAFKKATGQVATPPAAQSGQVSPADAAKAAIAKTPTPIPASLSYIPGGRVAGTNVFEAMDTMNSHELLAATSNMTAEQIEAWLNSQI